MASARVVLTLCVSLCLLAACDRDPAAPAAPSEPAPPEADGAEAEQEDAPPRAERAPEPLDPVAFPGLDDPDDAPEPTEAASDAGHGSAAAVQAVVRQAEPAVIACYRSAPGGEEAISGRLLLRFQIGTDGSVDQVTIDDSELPDEVRDCVAAVINGLTFPPPSEGSLWVELPYVFTASGGD